MIDIENQQDYFEVGEELLSGISNIVKKTVEAELRDEWEVCILLTNDQNISQLNADFRDKPCATDVLSFPANELACPLREVSIKELETQDGRIVLGDIAVNLQRANLQAEEFGQSFEREVLFLCVHGTLHLLGYDHMKAEDEAVMRQKQREVFI